MKQRSRSEMQKSDRRQSQRQSVSVYQVRSGPPETHSIVKLNAESTAAPDSRMVYESSSTLPSFPKHDQSPLTLPLLCAPGRVRFGFCQLGSTKAASGSRSSLYCGAMKE